MTGGGPRPGPELGAMFGLTFGEIGLVVFIVVAILTARFWPKLGEWVARRLVRRDG